MPDPQTIREHLSGHKIMPLDKGRTDGEFPIVECSCGWSTAYTSLADAFAEYADHLEANAVAALDLLDNAKWKAELFPDSVWRATELRLVPDPAPRGDAE